MSLVDLSLDECLIIQQALERNMHWWDKQYWKCLKQSKTDPIENVRKAASEVAITCNTQANDNQAVHRKLEPIVDQLCIQHCKEYQLYTDIIAHWGKDRQCICAIEELAELQKELTKQLKGEGNIDHIAEEIADCEIILAQIKYIYNLDNEVAKQRDYKLKRLRIILDAELVHARLNKELATHGDQK